MKLINVVSKLGGVGAGLALLAVFAMMMAGFGSRLGWWHFGTGFGILKWGAIGALGAAAVSLAGLVVGIAQKNRFAIILGISGLALGVSAAWVPWCWLQTARSVPAIHDITTDTENPPAFVAILPLRRNAPNPSEYGGPETAALQRAGYPDLGPKMLAIPRDAVFEQAVTAAREMCWEVVDANASEGRIEATATTRWFGFKDDVVVRVSPADGGSRIDVRSVSRVGRSDVGTNAKRIRRFFEKLPSGELE